VTADTQFRYLSVTLQVGWLYFGMTSVAPS
jgi:hypothetical protein